MKTRSLRTYAIALLALATFFQFGRLFAAHDGLHRLAVITQKGAVPGTVEGKPAAMWVHVNAHVADNGTANGNFKVRVDGGESFLFRVTGGQATVEDGTLVEAVFTLQRVGKDGSPTGETDILIVRPRSASPSEDCLIYTTIGTDLQFEATSNVRFKKHRRGE